MASFTVKLKVWNPVDPSRFAEIEAWADTGAAYSWISKARLEPLGVQKVRRLQFRTIEGHTVERDLAAVFLSAEGYTGGDNVVVAGFRSFGSAQFGVFGTGRRSRAQKN